MKRARGLIPAVYLALTLAGCAGSARPVMPIPIEQPAAAAPARVGTDDVHVVVIDDARPDNSYPHILLKPVPPANLSQPLTDGQKITIDVTATDSKGNPISLNGASIAWAKPVHGTIVPAKNGQSAVYEAPSKGSGNDTIEVAVVFPAQLQKYTANATVKYSPRG